MNTEALFLRFLKDRYPKAPAFVDVPAKRPQRFITVERTGGRRDSLSDKVTLAVQAWAETRAQAALLADEVTQLLLDAPLTLPTLASVDVLSVYNFPDPDSENPRYQMTVVATVFPGA
ncbi:DUF3168 domain-containing protein [Schaalia sp. ZJ405]|uniref:tail completion protein gp17 n=1 Tax=Schaalia sp. ZJ405 TaxID=2709403 RepID=UPI0013EAA6BB|nr:DUF3168 domain-containing protein [Schaalia sp. ZJ405]QPK80818.1 DUF3168 domain-containing protein [Schaalia sp. ZJ405]